MHPEICTIGPFTIYSYGLMLAIAFAVATLLLLRQAAKQGMNADLIFNLAFLIFVFGIVGGRVFYIFYNMSYYLEQPLEMIMLQHGGLAWFGGLFGGILAASVYLKAKKASFLEVMDLIVPFAALAHSIGRIGCLLNGCCYGWESAAGLYFLMHQKVLIPVQAYDSLILLVIYVVLRFFQERPHQRGVLFYAYLLLYAVSRFFVEFLRADNPRILFHLTLFQILSIFVFFFSLFVGIAKIRSK